MFVFALLVRYPGGDEAIYTASLLIVRFENTTMVMAYQRCVEPLLSHVVALTLLQFPVKTSYFYFMILPQNRYFITYLLLTSFR